MKTIDVDGLPETVAQALAGVVRTLRQELQAATERTNGDGREKVQLRVRPGKVIGRLTREEIYEDVA